MMMTRRRVLLTMKVIEFHALLLSFPNNDSSGFSPAGIGGDGLSRYRTDFHEIEKIGNGNFNQVFKVLKRIDGCMYAVKHSLRQLHQETKRYNILIVQPFVQTQSFDGSPSLGSLSYHEKIVGYFSSWFENEHLYIQLELCDHSLSVNKLSKSLTERQALEAMYQEYFVKSVDRVELMAFLGIFGAIISAFQITILKHDKLKSIHWTAGATFPTFVGFSVAMFLFYSGVPVLLKVWQTRKQ